MSSKNIVNHSASVRQRLYNLAKESLRPFDEVCQYYTIERFIYRLSQSPYQKTLILKGALMFMVWGFPYARPTKDIDFLGHTENNIENVVKTVKEICNIPKPEDGIHFLTDAMFGELIQHQNTYHGIRVNCPVDIANAKAKLQIDIGFGDIIHPEPMTFSYPTLLNTSSPIIYGYTPETLIAEKVHTMLTRGMTNSRIKDYFDVWFLSKQFRFQGNDILCALKKTFDYRGGLRNPTVDIVTLLSAFALEPTKIKQWDAFINRFNVVSVDFNKAVEQIQTFLAPVFNCIQLKQPFNRYWHPSGVWEIPC
jgi:hypothetical protein